MQAIDSAPATAQYLTFMLGDEVFAMDIRTVREIIQCGPMTPVPLMPGHVRGVINLRVRFGRPQSDLARKSCVVIIDVQRDDTDVELGLLVDAVSAVIEIDADAIEPPPQFGSRVQHDFIRAMARVEQRFIVILEPAKALDFDAPAAAQPERVAA